MHIKTKKLGVNFQEQTKDESFFKSVKCNIVELKFGHTLSINNISGKVFFSKQAVVWYAHYTKS